MHGYLFYPHRGGPRERKGQPARDHGGDGGGAPGQLGIACGLSDVLALLSGVPVTVDAMPEGTLFYPGEPVLRITGHYRDFCRYETAILGFLCHASGIASATAHIMCEAKGRPVYSFGSRRQHPAIATMIERAAWIGGVDGVSNTCAPPGMPIVGTMPHAMVMCFDTPEDAWRAFDRDAPADVPRIMLCDTYCDEKTESLRAAGCGATAVRLDTPGPAGEICGPSSKKSAGSWTRTGIRR